MHKILATVFACWLGGLSLAAGAETFRLIDGTSIAGDIAKYDETGILLHTPDDIYTNVAWTQFSQEALKQLAYNPKIRPYARPFVIIPLSERSPKEEIKIQAVSRLEVPESVPLFAALFSSSVGLVIMFLVYAANLYAALEIAICRSRSIGIVMGTAAVLPIVGPIIFLCLPVPGAPVVEPVAEPEPETMAVPGPKPMPELIHPPGVRPGVRISSSSWQQSPTSSAEPPPPPQIFQRGQFIFNRRFFETKFPKFFSLARHDADKEMLLLVKTPRGQYQVERITRVAANDIYLDIVQGEARQEVMIPFADIQEVILKHKNT